MQTRSTGLSRGIPAPAVPVQEPALHLLGGIWIASCPTCGYQLTTASTQQRCEQWAALRAVGQPPALPGLPRHA